MKDYNTLKMLFEIHHRQIIERRQKIHSITQRTIALLLVCIGWFMTLGEAPVVWLRVLIAGTIIAISVMSCYVIAGHNRTYIEICSVIRRLNEAFELFNKDRYIQDEAIYPDSWKEFGSQNWVRLLIHHWIAIFGMTIVCVVVLLKK
jgi:hypothetical protein